MKTEVLSQEKNVLVVKAEFDAAEVDATVARTIAAFSKKASIKGFRKGHVPRRAIELYYGKQGIYQEAAEDVLNLAVEQAVEEYDLDLLRNPEVKQAELAEGQPYTTEITFEVMPEIKLPDIESLEAEKTIYTPTEEMEGDELKHLLESGSEIEPLYEERELRGDDYVSVKFTSSIVGDDGVATPVEEGQKTEIFLGQDNIRPQIVEALTGKKPGESATIEFPVEEDAADRDLAGKNMRYDIEVLGIMKKVTPELSDEAAEKISNGRCKTVDELKEMIRNRLQLSASQHALDSLKASAVDKLMELSEVDLPESLLNGQIEAMKREQQERIEKDSDLSMDEFFEKSGMDRESYDAEVETSAKRIVKRSLVLEALAKKEGIQATPEEFNAEMQRMAAAARMDFEKFRNFVMSDNERIYEMTTRIGNRKTIDFLISKVKVKETEAAAEAEEASAAEPQETEE